MTKQERDARWARVVVEHVSRVQPHQKPARVRRHERRREERENTKPGVAWDDL